MKKLVLMLILGIQSLGAISYWPQQNDVVYIYAQHQNAYFNALIKIMKQFNINYKAVTSINTHDDNLHILFDSSTIGQANLPRNYIVYQTMQLTPKQMTAEFFDILAQAIVVWDYSRDNIARYQNRIHHYHYFPADYEFADPIILPCLLPKNSWHIYKDVVIYENQKNTDISSHLPTLLCYCLLQKPVIIFELGVRGGESTIPLHKTATHYNAQLLGVDIDPDQGVYTNLTNATFFRMNDLDFPTVFATNFGADKKCDIIFIDTSHLYEQTIQEITKFVPLLTEHGFIAFHDSNVTPLPNSGYVRLNGTHDGSPGNTRGVTQAIKEYFSLDFDEYNYFNHTFHKDGITWHIIHYPFCNGLTIIKKI